MENKPKKFKFIMDPKWITDGVIDSEHKEYVLMGYFQKLNKYLEDIKLYPMFIELSIHLGNIQTLITQNKMLLSKKKFLTYDDELVLSDLVLVDPPKLSEYETEEFKKVLLNTQPKLFDYFNIVKAIWTLVFDSITIQVKRNINNLKSKSGFFYHKKDNEIFIWRYDIKKVKNSPNQSKTSVKLIYKGDGEDLTVIQLLSKFSITYKEKGEKKFPIFEMTSTQSFSMDETLVPITKRKIMSLIYQSIRIENLEEQKKLIENGV
jgi:hypothetical protein